MVNDALPEDWDIIRSWLPSDLNALAKKHAFLRRARGLTDSECWLKLILMHVAGGLSLEQTVMRARELHTADVSAVALFKRLRKAEDWLRAVCHHLLAEQQKRLGRSTWPKQYRVRAIDATNVREPGATGSSWRLHYSIRLPELICDHYELTDLHGGESLGRFEFHEKELILADRGYCHWAGAAKVIDSGAHILMRWHTKSFPLYDGDCKPLNVLKHVSHLSKRTAGEWRVRFVHNRKTYRLRLCAVRKSRLATERALHKLHREAKAEGYTPSPQTIALAEFVLVLTTLPAAEFSASRVLELYRSRWQVELAFKRLKSLMGAGHVPKSDDSSARAWMQAKLLTALLVERLMTEAKIFSPWGYQLRDSEQMATNA
jgi:uncharacterized protein YegP (UPF0339 family)